MAKFIGVVSKVVGQVFAVDSDGSRRLLVEGDRLYAGEQLETGNAGAIAVRLDNGAELTLGRDSSLQMSPELLASQAAHVPTDDVAPSQAQLTDVERLQQAIAAGADPSEEAEATAAGPNQGAPGALGGGHSFVMLTEVADRVDPTVGFPTAGFNGVPLLVNGYIGDLDPTSSDDVLTPASPPPVNPPDNPVTLQGLDVSPGELILDEANLPDGSNSNPAALTQQGSFTVIAADGVFNLSVGGINVVTGGVVTGIGQSITTALGNTLTITGYNPATGVVNYSYTLNGTEQHANGGGSNVIGEQFPVQVSDSDGDVASGSVDVIIRDDVPKAVNDSNAVTATEQQLELTGNVLNNDVQGADRVVGGPVIAGTFSGTYGTLVLAADGTYTYTLNADDPGFKGLKGGGRGTESFTYTIRDADGDTSSATLTLNISNLNDPVTIGGLDVAGGELIVYEKNLVNGSAPDGAALTQNGTFTVAAPDGLQSLSVGGITVVSGGAAGGFPQSITTALGNTLTITGYNPATGVVSYSYTLLDNEAHATGNGNNSLGETFVVTAQDSDGSTASANLDVSIVDDVPKAVDDTNAVTATEQQVELSGNVLSNDVQGADRVVGGPVVAGTFTGTYGTLVLAADGTYTYTLNVDDADFKGLTGGGNGIETFTYTIKDADGDTSSATLTLNISNLNDPVILGGLDVSGGEVTVYEKNLIDGSAADGPALQQGGTFTVIAADGLQSLSVGGINVISGGVAAGFPQTITTALGNTLTITGYNPTTGVVSYTYTLLDNETHPDGNGTNGLQESFTVVAKDTDGSTATGSLDVTIVDDVPQAHCDFARVEVGGQVSGNVLANDVIGADDLADGRYVVGVRAGSDTSTPASGQLGVNVQGTYGYITLDAEGNGVYHAYPNSNAPAGATDVFVYTIRDADGDQSTTTITINVNNCQMIAGQDTDVTVYENALDMTKDGNDLAPGTVTGSQPGSTGETASGTLVGSVTGGVGALTYSLVGNTAGQFGQIQVNADGSYTYTLTSPANSPTHQNDGPNIITETFTYQVKDSLGNTTTSNIVISIVDDVPQAHCDVARVEMGGQVSGNVLLNDVIGADVSADGKYVVGVRAGSDTSTPASGQLGVNVQGTYGYITLDAEGNGVYHSNPNSNAPAGATDTFVYTIRDADGDESTATVTINVLNCQMVAAQDHDVTVHENALDLTKDGNDLAPGTVTGSQPGSTGETANGTLVGSVTGGVGALTYSLVGNTEGQFGQIQVNADGSYTYTLTSPANSPTHQNDGPNIITESFTYQVKDSLGNTTTSNIVISIVDDVPQAHCDVARVEMGGQVSGNVLLNDVIGADVSADGKYVVGVRAGSDTSTPASGQLGVNVQGTYGYITLDAEGNGVYHSNPNSNAPAGATDTFVYTIRDADGDESTATVTINVLNCQMVAAQDHDVTVHENALDLTKDGNDLAPGTVTGSQPGSIGETASGTLVGSVTGGVGALTYSLVGNTAGQFGQIQVNADGSYTYTLTSPANSPTHQNDGPNIITETFTYQVKDSLGNTTTSNIVISIVDDVPQAHCDVARVEMGGQVSGNVLLNDVIGADVSADGKYVVGVRAGSDTSTPASGQLGVNVQGTYGYITLDAEGNGVYHSYPNSNAPEGATDTFVYTIRDADGDQSTATVSINVLNCQMVATPDHDVTVYENALDLNKDCHDLAPGTVLGSQPGSAAETASGTLVGAVSGGVGILTYSLVGNAEGHFGQIQVNGDGSYTYTLTSPASTSPQQNDGPNIVTETFTYQVKDSLGNTTTSNIVVSIVDDVPQAHCDFANVVEGSSVTGNLLWNDVIGADVSAAGQYVIGIRAGSDTSTSAVGQLGTEVQGAYGYATLDANGNGVYHANPNSVSAAGATDTFVYTIRDADGDESTTTVTFNVQDASQAGCADGAVGARSAATDKAAPIRFDVDEHKATGSLKELARSAFAANSGAMTSALVVAGYLAQMGSSHAGEQDVYTVALRKGETLTLDHDRAPGNLLMEWKGAAGSYHPVADGGSFTASHDGLYSIQLTSTTDSTAPAQDSFKLSLLIDSSNAQGQSHPGGQTVGSDPATGTADIVYHADSTGSALTADTLLAVEDGKGEAVLVSSPGNDLLEGGHGIDTVSYATANAGVVVDLNLVGQQDTGGGGLDTLVRIDNLIGSDYHDTLIGNASDNVLIGGRGDDLLTGGGGNDTFVWQKGDTGHDTVTDFTPGADHLDLSQLLQADGGAAASLDDFLHFKVSAAGGTVVSTIEVSSVAGAAPSQTIDLAGVDLAQHYGVTAGAGGLIASGHDTATIINGMLNDHSLKVDTV